MNLAPIPVLVDNARGDLASWLASYGRARWFGGRCEARLPPLDGEGSRMAFDVLSEMYWSGMIDPDERRAARDEIDRASRSFWLRGTVAYSPAKGKTRRVLKAILERDGTDCWLCGKHMPENDRTIEHLNPRSLGGGDEMDNLAAAHRQCNSDLGNLPLSEKEAMRAERREQLAREWTDTNFNPERN